MPQLFAASLIFLWCSNCFSSNIPLHPPNNGLIEVVLDEGTNMAAALSPDGQSIAIDLLGQLWLLPVAGGEAHPITDELGDIRQPAWSPNGQSIAFQAYWSGNWHIYTIQKDNT